MTRIRLARSAILFALALPLVSLSPTPARAQQSIRGNVLPSHTMLRRHGLVRMWWGQAALDPSQDVINHMLVDEDVVVMQASSGAVTTFDSESGRRLWSAQLGPRDAPSQAAVTNKDFAFIPAARKLYCLDKFSGELLWELKLPRTPSTSPAVSDDQIFYGSYDGSIYAFDLHRVRDLYLKNQLDEWGFLARQWRFKTGKQITTPPIATGRVVNFASLDNSLYSITAGSPRLQWQSETDSPVSAPVTYHDGFLYVACEDFNLYCLNAENGNARWQPFPSGFPIRHTPQVIGEQVFIFPDAGGVFSISTLTGKRIWWRNGVRNFVSSSLDRLYTTDRVGNVVILRRTDGAVMGTMPLRQFGVKYANPRTDRLFLATNSGLLVAIREAGAQHEFPVYHQNPDLLPILPEFAPETPPATTPANPTPPQPAPAPAPAPAGGGNATGN